MLGYTRQEQSWQRSVGCGNRSPLKHPRPLKLHPSHTPHEQPSRAGCGHDTAGHLRCAHTTSPLYGKKEDNVYCEGAASQRPQTKCSPSPSHWACAVLAPSLSSRKDLSISVSHTLELTTCTQSETSVIHLLYITWTVICCKPVTVTDGAAAWVGDRVRTEGCWTRLLHALHRATL